MKRPHWRRDRQLFGSDVERDLADEVRFHLETEIEALVAAGRSPDDARREALSRFGNVDRFIDECRASDVRRRARGQRADMLRSVLQDVRYGLRILLRNPGFSTTVVLSLALGIGANTAIFSVFDALLFRPLPVASPNELVLATQRFEDRQSLMLSNRQREAFDGSETLVGLCASRHSRLRETMPDGAQLVDGMLVGGNCFSLLGVSAALGRMITDEDDRPSAAQLVAVLSNGFWQRRFGGDRRVIGQTITLQDRTFTIIGVGPTAFAGLEPGRPADVFVPLTALGGPLLRNPDVGWLRVVGRRKSNVTMAQVQADLAVRFARVPRSPRAKGRPPILQVVDASSGFGDVPTEYALPLRILMTAVVLVLLIACMNVASLLIARASRRRTGIKIRISLGANRARLVRQLLTESLLLSSLGGGLGLALALLSTPLLTQAISRGGAPIVIESDSRTLAFTAAVSLLTGLLFGIVPALRTVQRAGSMDAQSSARMNSGARRWSAALIIAQVALSVVVLVSAGLLLGSLRKLQHVDPGFGADHLLMLNIQSDKDKGVARRRVQQELTLRLSSLPGVASVTTFQDVPLGGANVTTNDFSVDDIGPRFFETLQIPLVIGRTLNAEDTLAERPAVVISESVARQFFREGNPLGGQLDVFGAKSEVVGVVKDARYRGLRLPPEPMVYRMAGGADSYALRTREDPTSLINTVRREVRSVAPDVPIVSLSALDTDDTLARERIVSAVCFWFGAFALLLASFGLYGRLAYAVAERTREIGVRMAVGARHSQVVWIILKDALILAICGIAAGIPLAVSARQVIQSLLFGVGSGDLVASGAILAGIIGVAVVAAYVPARRAAAIDPVVALRTE